MRYRTVTTGLALGTALFSSAAGAAALTTLDFTNLGRPSYEVAIAEITRALPLALEISGAVRETFGLPGSTVASVLSAVLQVGEVLGGIKTILDVSTAQDVTDLANKVSGISTWEPYVDALTALRTQLNKLDRDVVSLSAADFAPPSEISTAVVVSKAANDAARKASRDLSALVASHGDVIPTLQTLREQAATISAAANNLSDVSFEVAQIIAEAGLGGLLYPNLLNLVGNGLVLSELSRLASDVETSSALLLNRYSDNLVVASSALETYNAALARPMALAEYTFSSTFPNSPPSRCGYVTNFAPNNFVTSGVDALPTFIIGAWSLRLTQLTEDFQDGCQGQINVEVTRTITGLPDIGTDIQAGTSTVDYFYSVEIAGEENLYLLDLAKTVDFSGFVGEAEAFLLYGSIQSPFEIIDVSGDGTLNAPLVYTTTPEQQALLNELVQVPEPTSLSFLVGAVGLLGVLRWSRRTKQVA